MTDEVRAAVVKELQLIEDYALQEANLSDTPGRYWGIRGIAQVIETRIRQIEVLARVQEG